MRVLHLVRDPGEPNGLEVARQQAETDTVAVILLQEAVRLPAPADVPTFALEEGVGAQRIDVRELIRLIETHDRIFVW